MLGGSRGGDERDRIEKSSREQDAIQLSEKEGNPMARKGKTRKIHRSAVTGKFVTKQHARRHPRTTVEETVKVPRRRKK